LPSGSDCPDAESRCDALRASETAQSHPCSKDTCYDSGGKDYAHGLQRALLDGMPGVIDRILGGMAPLFYGPERRSDAIVHSVTDCGFEFGYLAKNIIDGGRFLQQVCWHYLVPHFISSAVQANRNSSTMGCDVI
jgi:hypothetical protein